MKYKKISADRNRPIRPCRYRVKSRSPAAAVADIYHFDDVYYYKLTAENQYRIPSSSTPPRSVRGPSVRLPRA